MPKKTGAVAEHAEETDVVFTPSPAFEDAVDHDPTPEQAEFADAELGTLSANTRIALKGMPVVYRENGDEHEGTVDEAFSNRTANLNVPSMPAPHRANAVPFSTEGADGTFWFAD